MTLLDQDKIAYLSNVLLITYADKMISPRESAALEEIRKGIDAKKSHLTSAQKNVEGGSYIFTKVGSFADQVRNLEDILFVALMDSDPDEQKRILIDQFSQKIGIYKEQLDRLMLDTARRCDQADHSLSCPACSTAVPTQSRFCPSCGAALTATESPSVQIGFEIPPQGYAIEFCESTAAGFPAAVDIARSTGTMQTATKNKKTWYLATFPSDQFSAMVPIASSLSGMRNRRVYLDGKEMNWDEVFGFTWCATQRSTAYRPIEYCFGKDENRLNPWGCKQSRMDWTDWAQWFSYGQWQKSGFLKNAVVFVFDKQRIQHELATALYRFRFCPHMRSTMIEAVLRNLPERVEVTSNGPWKYNRCYEEVPGSIKVIEKQGSGNFTYSNEYYSDGVRPLGHTVYADILNKALQECRCTDLSLTNLLKT
jgi:hypothetical protein